MGSSKKPKQRVVDYYMSLHFGLCHPVDEIQTISIKETSVFDGTITANTKLAVSKRALFGGSKKEGGVEGTIHFLLGGENQVLEESLAARLGTTSADAPGFRGLTSLFFTENPTSSNKGFFWSSNYPYLHPVWAKVRRTKTGWYEAKSTIGGTTINPSTFARTRNDTVTKWPFGSSCPIITGYADGKISVTALNSTSTAIIDEATGDIISTGTASIAAYGTNDFTLNGVSYRSKHIGRIGSKQLWAAGLIYPSHESPWRLAIGAAYNGTTIDTVVPSTVDLLGAAIDPVANRALLIYAAAPGNQINSLQAATWQEVDENLNVIRSGTVTGTINAYHIGMGNAVTKAYPPGFSMASYDATLSLLVTMNTVGSATYTNLYQIQDAALVQVASNSFASGQTSFNYGSCFISNGQIVAYSWREDPYYSGRVLGKFEMQYANSAADMNPAHMIRDCLTNTDWGMSLPTAMIDDASFTVAADKLYAEGFGLSMVWSGQSEIQEFVNEILNHIDGTYGIDPTTGKFYLKLIRGGYDTSTLAELTPDNCRITTFQRKALSETTNEIVATWTNPANEQEETVVVHDLANYSEQGAIVSSSRNYYGIRSADLALRCAMRELAKASQPTATFEVECGREAWSWKSGDVVKVTYPEFGLNGLPCRVASKNDGKPGDMTIKLSLIEDTFDLPATAYTTVDSSMWNAPAKADTSLTSVEVTTAPYFFLVRASGDQGAADITYPAAYPLILASSTAPFADILSPTTDLLGNVSYTSSGKIGTIREGTLTGALVKEVTSTTTATGNLMVGDVCFIGNVATGEIAIVQSTSPLVLRRGMLDTVPAVWPAGTKLKLVQPTASLSDDEARTVGGTQTYRIVQDGGDPSYYVGAATTFTSRAYKPYRPGKVTINGSLFPTVISGVIDMTWASRNRTLDNVTPVKWDAASVTPEAGTTYNLTIYGETGAAIKTVTGLASTGYYYSTETTDAGRWQGTLRIKLEAVRDGYVSHQAFDHTFNRAGYGLSYGNYYGGI